MPAPVTPGTAAPNTPSAAQRLARPGFKVEELATESFEFPSRNNSNAPIPSSLISPGVTTEAALPPGHPLRVRAEQEALKALVESRPATPQMTPTGQKVAPQGLGRQERPQSETDPDFFSITLPSLFKLYPFQNLSIRNIKGKHQAKFNRASKERNLRYLVEALSSTLGDGLSAFDLTPNDFQFLLYWQRVASFPKNPQLISFTCTNKEHVKRTLYKEDHPEYLDPKTLDIESYLERTTLDTEYLDDMDLTPFVELQSRYALGYETMRDLVEYQDLAEEIQVGKLPEEDKSIALDELLWLSGRAAFLARTEEHSTLPQRISIVEDMDADAVQELEEYIEVVTKYGVRESVDLTCKECKAHHRVKISVDALDFLPKS